MQIGWPFFFVKVRSKNLLLIEDLFNQHSNMGIVNEPSTLWFELIIPLTTRKVSNRSVSTRQPQGECQGDVSPVLEWTEQKAWIQAHTVRR